MGEWTSSDSRVFDARGSGGIAETWASGHAVILNANKPNDSEAFAISAE